MAKNDVERVTEEKLARGGVLAKIYFDVRHADKEKLQPLLLDLINDRLMKEPGIIYCFGAIEEPIPMDNTFVTSGVVTVLFEGFFPLIDVAFKYSPAGIEILKPAKDMTFKIAELQKMLSMMSDISMNYSKYIFENVMKPEERAIMEKHIEDRAMIAKKLHEGQNKKEEEKK